MTSLRLVEGPPLEVPRCGRCAHVVSVLIPSPSALIIFDPLGGARIAIDLDDLGNVAPDDAAICACYADGGRAKLDEAGLDALAEVLESLAAYRQAYGSAYAELTDRWVSAPADAAPRHPSGDNRP